MLLRMVLLRIAAALPVIFLMTFLAFFLISLIPGNAATVLLGADATPERIAELNSQLGLDRPVWEQYTAWVANAVTGDLGRSLFTGQEVTRMLEMRIMPTFWLALLAAVMCGIVGTAIGVFAAIRGGAVSRALDAISMLGLSLPNFWVALILVVVFAGTLGWLPAIGYVAPEKDLGEWLRRLILPILALGTAGIALIAKQARDAFAQALSRDFMRFMQANGIPRSSLLFRHGLRHASVPIIAAISVTFINFFTQSAAIELVFAIPGLGAAVVHDTKTHDLLVVQGIVFTYTLVTVVVIVVSDVVYALLNPKVRS